MALKFRDRTKEPSLKKVLIYGLDGSGKSTFAEQYCKDNGFKAVVLDIDDTNYTNLPIVELNFSNDVTTFNSIKNAIKELTVMDDFDTIILDGVTSLLEMLVSKAKGMAQYSDRSKRWNEILRLLLASKKNLIFIGQIDMELIYTPDAQSSKAVIKVNSLVNEKYLTYINDKGEYTYDVKKMRTLAQIESEANKPKEPEVPKEPQPNTLDSTKDIAKSIIAELPVKDLLSAKVELAKLLKMGIITQEECPKVLSEIERLLA